MCELHQGASLLSSFLLGNVHGKYWWEMGRRENNDIGLFISLDPSLLSCCGLAVSLQETAAPAHSSPEIATFCGFL